MANGARGSPQENKFFFPLVNNKLQIINFFTVGGETLIKLDFSNYAKRENWVLFAPIEETGVSQPKKKPRKQGHALLKTFIVNCDFSQLPERWGEFGQF